MAGQRCKPFSSSKMALFLSRDKSIQENTGVVNNPTKENNNEYAAKVG